MTGIKGMKGSGGKRIGAGAKRKYGEETVNITFRVPKSQKEHIKAIVNRELLLLRSKPKQ